MRHSLRFYGIKTESSKPEQTSAKKKQELREKELRDRYDKVIVDMQAREDAMRTQIVKEINDLDKRMSLLEQKLEQITIIVNEIKARFQRVV